VGDARKCGSQGAIFVDRLSDELTRHRQRGENAMATVINVTTYDVSGMEIKLQNNHCVWQPAFLQRSINITFSDEPVSQTLDLGSGYSLDVRTNVPPLANQQAWIEYSLEKPGSPFSDPDGIIDVARGNLTRGRYVPSSPTDAPFPYWFFYANIDVALKVWVRFATLTREGSPLLKEHLARDAAERARV
jgi:hypothetical protein